MFTVDFFFRGLYLANHRRDYLLSLAGLINMVVILPVIPVSFLHEDQYVPKRYGYRWRISR
jgi:hypothetical protein